MRQFNYYRWLTLILLVIATMTGPWWLGVGGALVLAGIIPRYYQGLVAPFLTDLLYGVSQGGPFGFQFTLTAFCLLFIVLIEHLR